MSDGKGSMSYFMVTLPGFCVSSFPWNARISSDGVLGLAERQQHTVLLCHNCHTSRLKSRIGMLGPDCSGGKTTACRFLAHHEQEVCL